MRYLSTVAFIAFLAVSNAIPIDSASIGSQGLEAQTNVEYDGGQNGWNHSGKRMAPKSNAKRAVAMHYYLSNTTNDPEQKTQTQHGAPGSNGAGTSGSKDTKRTAEAFNEWVWDVVEEQTNGARKTAQAFRS